MKEIPLSQEKVALVDDEDFALVCQFKWHANRSSDKWYAYSRTARKNGSRKTIIMHRLIMNAPQGVQVDHRNGDGLDNRRQNLRLANHIENMRNRRKPITAKGKAPSSRFKGVSRHGKKWTAVISTRNAGKVRNLHLGSFSEEETAARAYDRKAIELFGEFARTNFSSGEYITNCEQKERA